MCTILQCNVQMRIKNNMHMETMNSKYNSFICSIIVKTLSALNALFV